MMNNENKNTIKNPEGYNDTTPYNAIKNIEGAELKAYKLYQTMLHMARLAGFKIVGTVMLEDGNKRVYDGEELKRANYAAIKARLEEKNC